MKVGTYRTARESAVIVHSYLSEHKRAGYIFYKHGRGFKICGVDYKWPPEEYFVGIYGDNVEINDLTKDFDRAVRACCNQALSLAGRRTAMGVMSNSWPPNCAVCGRFHDPSKEGATVETIYTGGPIPEPSHEEFVCADCAIKENAKKKR